MSKQLTSEQRYEIYLGIKRGWTKTFIAKEIGVHPSTVCREIRRNSNSRGEYVWITAHKKSERRKHGFAGNNRKSSLLWWRVEQLIMEDWSPAVISGVLAKDGIRICKQTIYNHVHADTTGRLARHLPHELKYRKRAAKHRPTKATNIANRTSIHDRPEAVDGKRFGDWEMDLIVDSFGHAILTMVERSTNFLIMEKLPHGRKSEPVAKAVTRLLFPYREAVKTITTDNGPEFAAHLSITEGLRRKNLDDVIVYFADSYCSWQKGRIENANKLIRKYIPKHSNFDDLSDKRIMEIQKKLNRRPREKLNFDTPKNCFFRNLS